MRRTTIAIVLSLLLATGVAACGGDDDRPGRAEWRTDWDATSALVPSVDEVEQQGEEICGRVLGDVRAQREVLMPTPFETVDETVDQWIALVEGFGLDCPTEAAELEERLSEIDELTAEIDRRTGIDQ